MINAEIQVLILIPDRYNEYFARIHKLSRKKVEKKSYPYTGKHILQNSWHPRGQPVPNVNNKI